MVDFLWDSIDRQTPFMVIKFNLSTPRVKGLGRLRVETMGCVSAQPYEDGAEG
jgi:hypothetical protein